MSSEIAVSDIIIWGSPIVGAFALYLAHDAYSEIKDQLKDLRERQVRTREDIAEVKASVNSVGDAVNAVSKVATATAETMQKLDTRSGNTREMEIFVKQMERKLSEHEANYGKVILILKKVVAILRPKNPQEPRE